MGSTHFSGPVLSVNGFNPGTGSSEVISADRTMVAADNGKIFFLDATTGQNITLPTITAGMYFKFIVTSTFITDPWIIAAVVAASINGMVIVDDAAIIGAAEDQVNLVETAESIGDWVEFTADPTNDQWIIYGHGELTGAMTLSAV